MELVSRLVEIFHLLLFEGDAIDLLFRTELIFSLQTGAQVAHLGLDEAPFVAGGDVNELHDAVEIILMHDNHPHTQLGCWYEHIDPPGITNGSSTTVVASAR